MLLGVVLGVVLGDAGVALGEAALGGVIDGATKAGAWAA